MDRKSKDGMPRYQQIALDIATQIVKQQYKVGDRIYARSSLASKYHVSPETARRAICLLADMDIVEAEKGSGVVKIPPPHDPNDYEVGKRHNLPILRVFT